MKIGEVNISNSSVTFAERIDTIQYQHNFGVDEEETIDRMLEEDVETLAPGEETEDAWT